MKNDGKSRGRRPRATTNPLSKRFYESARPDGRFVDTRAFTYYLLKNARPRLAFDPDMSGDEFARWRGKVRDKMREILDFPTPPPQPEPRMIWSKQREGYALQRWESFPEDGCVIPFLLLVPDGVSAANPAPGVLCIPGTLTGKEQTAGEPVLKPEHFFEKPHAWMLENNRFAKHFARAGYMAAAVDHINSTEQNQARLPAKVPASYQYQNLTSHEQTLRWLGRDSVCMALFHKYVILQWLKAMPCVNGRGVAIAGHSLGASEAMWLALVDSEVRAIVYNDNIETAGSQRARGLMTGLQLRVRRIPGSLAWFDKIDTLAALAPCPLLVSEGGRADAAALLRKAYRIAGVPRHFTFVHYPKYAKRSARKHDRKPLPEFSLDMTYYKHINCDWPTHCFRIGAALPWMQKHLPPVCRQ